MNHQNYERHAYTNFTGKPYIYYNGVQINRPNPVSDNSTNHPNRSIIWPNVNDKHSIEYDERPFMVKQTLFPKLYSNCNYSADNFFK